MTTLSAADEKSELEFVNLRIPVPWGYIAGRWYGNRNVRPLLALHGWLDNIGTWYNLLPLLPKYLGVLCVELPGHGQSSKLPKGIIYHQMDFVEIIIYIMREYNWEKVSLLTHSLSSVVSFIFASIFPERVDMFISIDMIKPVYYKPDTQINKIFQGIEKFIIEDERVYNTMKQEPPSYTYDQLVEVLYKGTNGSVDLENTHHLLERNITKSSLYPNKYYFSRDARLKHYMLFLTDVTFIKQMALRIYNVPYCVIKGSDSNFIETSDEFIDLFTKNNPYFEFHVITGTHHVHLNNAKDVAAVINPFIIKHRPPLLERWAVVDENGVIGTENIYIKQKRKINEKVKSKI